MSEARKFWAYAKNKAADWLGLSDKKPIAVKPKMADIRGSESPGSAIPKDVTQHSGRDSRIGSSNITGSTEELTDLNPITKQDPFILTPISALDLEKLAIIRKYESGPDGYNAINQWGGPGGTTNIWKSKDGSVVSHAGDIRKMTQHGGRALSDYTVKEIMDLQFDDKSKSMEEWVGEGKLHAVGAYQFVGDTLKHIVGQTGIDVNQKFSNDLQDRLALHLLNTTRDPDHWVSLKPEHGKITPGERRILETWDSQLFAANR